MCPGRIAADAVQMAGSAFGELVPPEAQVHLLNAQRELFMALKVTIEHHARHEAAEERRARRESRRPVRVELE
ncbi:MAG TPA: hypothetical protein VJU79_01175 [Candidatus Dormibacteraeota bacterium]|nr:hypothetical protein [Candidatus Dormibacteraeota bacterium]